MYEDESYFCPMLNRKLWDSECYDIQMVHYGFIKESVLDFALDKEKAESICGSCPFNQLHQSEGVFKKEEAKATV